MHSVTLGEIHQDPSILDRAIEQREVLEIRADGKLIGTLMPATVPSGASGTRPLPFPLIVGVPGVVINPTKEQLSDF